MSLSKIGLKVKCNSNATHKYIHLEKCVFATKKNLGIKNNCSKKINEVLFYLFSFFLFSSIISDMAVIHKRARTTPDKESLDLSSQY